MDIRENNSDVCPTLFWILVSQFMQSRIIQNFKTQALLSPTYKVVKQANGVLVT